MSLVLQAHLPRLSISRTGHRTLPTLYWSVVTKASESEVQIKEIQIEIKYYTCKPVSKGSPGNAHAPKKYTKVHGVSTMDAFWQPNFSPSHFGSSRQKIMLQKSRLIDKFFKTKRHYREVSSGLKLKTLQNRGPLFLRTAWSLVSDFFCIWTRALKCKLMFSRPRVPVLRCRSGNFLSRNSNSRSGGTFLLPAANLCHLPASAVQ